MSASLKLTLIAPQFDSVTGRADFLALAADQVNDCMFGDKTDLAIAYLAAHLIALNTDPNRQQGESGSITSKKEGDLAISYGNFKNNNTKSDLDLTFYGQQFQSLANASTLNIGLTGEETLFVC